jgi:hypothetical protein
MKNLPYYLIVLFVFMALSNELWSDGMFVDGIYYATISRNLSKGLGSFWFLSFTEVEGIFYAHPPLAMGLQSILFSIFGDSIYIERFYSFSTFLITGFFIHLIWREVTESKYHYYSWIPLFFWILIPLNGWACSNNFLENTMNIFVSASVFFSIRNIKTEKLSYLILSGLSIFLAFLSKGFTGLFPLSIFFCFFLLFSSMKMKDIIIKTSLILTFLLTPFLLLYIFYTPAIDSLSNYINIQVIHSIKESATVGDRFHIIKLLSKQLKIFQLIGIMSIIIYLSLSALRKLNLIDSIKKNISLILIIICFIFLPKSLWKEFIYNVTSSPVTNAFIYLVSLTLLIYLSLHTLIKLDLLYPKRKKKLLIFFIILISLIVLKVWRYHIIKLINEFPINTSALLFLLISISFYCLKKKKMIYLLRENKWLIFFIVISLLFDWALLFDALLNLINKFPLLSFIFLSIYISFQIFKKKEFISSRKENKWILFFIILGFSGILPMMISLKQSPFYMITTLPFFSIALGMIAIPVFHYLSSKTNKNIVILLMLTLLLFLGPFFSTSTKFLIPHTQYLTFNSLKHQYERTIDKDLIEDIKLIMSVVPNNSIIDMDFEKNWKVHAYLARHSNISLSIDENKKYLYLISFEDGWSYEPRKQKYIQYPTELQEGLKRIKKKYTKVDLLTNRLHLYKRNTK